MKLKAEHKREILEDFEYAVRKMKEVHTPVEKLFYFSSTYGVLSRVFNSKFDPQLVFMHQLLSNAHSTIMARVQAIRVGDNSIQITEDFFDKLTQAVEEMTSKLKSDKNIYEILEKIAVLTYVTTGNGYYLLQKGTISIL